MSSPPLRSPTIPAVPRAFVTIAVIVPLLVLAACQPGPTRTPVRPGSTSQPNTTPAATAGSPVTPAEANVITGRVTTELGEPIPGARMRIVGYTGGATLGREYETIETDADGVYRSQVPNGLYEVLGMASVPFDGQVYVFNLEPADGRCDQQMSDDGIVADFVLRLTGIHPCNTAADPDTYTSYHGAAIQLFGRFTGLYSPDAVVVFTLAPFGPLADGGSGDGLTLTRTVGAFATSAGPIEETWLLHDIPLGQYDVSAVLVEPGGDPAPLFLARDTSSAPARSVDMSFGARLVLGTPDVGYLVPQLYVHDEAGP